jgi:hypothetical protein
MATLYCASYMDVEGSRGFGLGRISGTLALRMVEITSNSRPHNYLEQRIQRAEIEASGGGHVMRHPERTKRRRDNSTPDEDAGDRETSCPSRRLMSTPSSGSNFQFSTRPAMTKMASYKNGPPRMLQVLENMSDASIDAGARPAMFKSPEVGADVQNQGIHRSGHHPIRPALTARWANPRPHSKFEFSASICIASTNRVHHQHHAQWRIRVIKRRGSFQCQIHGGDQVPAPNYLGPALAPSAGQCLIRR